jgi:hypothetical protein
VRNQADGEKATPLPALVFSVKAVASLKSRVTRCRVVTVPSASLTWTMPSTGMEAGACWSLRYSRQLLLTGQHGVLGPAVAATAGARSMQVHHQPRRQRGHVGTRCGSITARIRRRVLKTDVDRRERNAPLTALRKRPAASDRDGPRSSDPESARHMPTHVSREARNAAARTAACGDADAVSSAACCADR